MAQQPLTTAYAEVQIDEDSVSLTLITEDGSNGPVIEDTERFTFEELQSLSGEHLTLSLSGDTEKEMVKEDLDLPEPGTILNDKGAPWLDNRVEVVDVLKDTTCGEYVVGEGDTVARLNPSYDSDQPVILARYYGNSQKYAFPAERLQ